MLHAVFLLGTLAQRRPQLCLITLYGYIIELLPERFVEIIETK